MGVRGDDVPEVGGVAEVGLVGVVVLEEVLLGVGLLLVLEGSGRVQEGGC